MLPLLEAKSNTGVVLRVYPDDDVNESPRDWDNLGTMICFHARYALGDKHDYKTPRDFLEELAAEVATRDEIISVSDRIAGKEEAYESEEEYCDVIDDLEDGLWVEKADDEELWKIINNHAVILPLYLFDHSGITIKTSPFSCPWDSGQVGWIYVTHQKIKEEYGSHDVDRRKAKDVLDAEVETYDVFLRGAIYGFSLDEEVTCNSCGNVSEEHIDSCWGIYANDLEDLKSAVRDMLPDEYYYLIDRLKETD